MKRHGFSLIEVIVVLSLLGIFAVGISQSLLFVERVKITSAATATALSLAEETMEILIAKQDNFFGTAGNWSTEPQGEYYLDSNLILHPFTAETEAITDHDGFFRKITIENALRDNNFNLSATGTVIDFYTKKIMVKIWYYDAHHNKHEKELQSILTAWEKI